ncbi:MAG: dephospho-CoA kinase [Thermodesulfobacteriota bacterium]|nr:dephospho-CoA kinase [Thermodesulfobacteriota bacterium]
MLKIGLTGSIGSGKTTIARIFESLGVNVYYADDEAKKFLLNKKVKKNIEAIFGSSVIDDNLEIDKKVLADIVFHDTESLKKLNNIIHPLVENDFNDWALSLLSEKYVIQEAAIIFESGLKGNFDEIITVIAPPELRLARIIERDNVKNEDFFKRDKNQWDDDKKAEMSDYVIYNDGHHLLIPQVLNIHRKMIKAIV